MEQAISMVAAAALLGLFGGCDSTGSTEGSGETTTSSSAGGEGGATSSGGATGGTGTGGMSTGGTSTGGMSTGGAGGSPEELPPGCLPSCTTVADCVVANATPAFDADNYACVAGACQYTGCNSTKECKDSWPSLDYVCADITGVPYKGCLPGCATVADCVVANATPAFDADNYACVAGACQYTGCNSTKECKDSWPTLDYVCH